MRCLDVYLNGLDMSTKGITVSNLYPADANQAEDCHSSCPCIFSTVHNCPTLAKIILSTSIGLVSRFESIYNLAWNLALEQRGHSIDLRKTPWISFSAVECTNRPNPVFESTSSEIVKTLYQLEICLTTEFAMFVRLLQVFVNPNEWTDVSELKELSLTICLRSRSSAAIS